MFVSLQEYLISGIRQNMTHKRRSSERLGLDESTPKKHKKDQQPKAASVRNSKTPTNVEISRHLSHFNGIYNTSRAKPGGQ